MQVMQPGHSGHMAWHYHGQCYEAFACRPLLLSREVGRTFATLLVWVVPTQGHMLSKHVFSKHVDVKGKRIVLCIAMMSVAAPATARSVLTVIASTWLLQQQQNCQLTCSGVTSRAVMIPLAVATGPASSYCTERCWGAGQMQGQLKSGGHVPDT